MPKNDDEDIKITPLGHLPWGNDPAILQPDRKGEWKEPFITLTELDPQDEWYFLKWYRDWADRTGINPDPDDPLHFYDYRAAWKNKDSPSWDENEKQYHWPSKYKLKGHPRMILDGINTKTGERVR